MRSTYDHNASKCAQGAQHETCTGTRRLRRGARRILRKVLAEPRADGKRSLASDVDLLAPQLVGLRVRPSLRDLAHPDVQAADVVEGPVGGLVGGKVSLFHKRLQPGGVTGASTSGLYSPRPEHLRYFGYDKP